VDGLDDKSAEGVDDVLVDGCGLGCADGLDEISAEAEGLDDVLVDGCGLGCADGLGDGKAEGLNDVAVDGCGLGCADGLNDGKSEGFEDGAGEGGFVGHVSSSNAILPTLPVSLPLELAIPSPSVSLAKTKLTWISASTMQLISSLSIE
jgi:hypothetical protein